MGYIILLLLFYGIFISNNNPKFFITPNPDKVYINKEKINFKSASKYTLDKSNNEILIEKEGYKKIIIKGLNNTGVNSLFFSLKPLSEEDVFIESNSKLMWQDDQTVLIEHSYENLENYCKNLFLEGFSDWRYPTETELISISKAMLLDTSEKSFNYIDYGVYSSSKILSPPSLYGVDFSLLLREREGVPWNMHSRLVRCVRDL